jgi:NADH-quinone oxidoreductase subunit D
MSNNLAYVRAVEELAEIEVPIRAQYIRVISAELQRIASHLVATGFFLQELGVFGTILMYCFRERERILDLFEMLSGARMTLSYMRPGGVTQDAPESISNTTSILSLSLKQYIRMVPNTPSS